MKWVFLQSEMCNQLFKTDIRMYNVSSLKQLIFGDSAINYDIYEKLMKYFINASIIQVYSMYNFNQLSMIEMHCLSEIDNHWILQAYQKQASLLLTNGTVNRSDPAVTWLKILN